jgi:putative aldouronate transport system substrate-binding protein
LRSPARRFKLVQSNAEFVTGQRDINDDGAWAAYKSDLENLGLARYLELYQIGYDASAK